ncbi:MAG: hypothetical protein ACK4M9_22070 [Anaerobacillus sp.]|uniref:hypothetical protein n=1 Tax=Anaerobacillus sp. TaxID=1872506 RepID=UPI0039192CAA
MNVRKKTSFLVTAILVIVIFSGARYSYIKNMYTKPHEVAGFVIQEALEGKVESDYLISEEQWILLSEESIYKVIREPIDWDYFSDFVQECERNAHSSLLYNNGKATYQVMKDFYKDHNRRVTVECLDFNKENGDVLEVNYTTFLMEEINNSWKVVGKVRGDN